MKLLKCPVNGVRAIQEFSFGGAVREMPEGSGCSDEQWADYVFNRAGEPGVQREWWYHMASGTWFIAERETVSDQVIRTYLWNGDDAS